MIKKFLSVFIVIVMLAGVLPVISLSEESATLCFTYAWDADKIDVDGSATVASWTGGSNNSYRGAFVVFDLPNDFRFDESKDRVRIDFSINSATLNNGLRQAPTAAVVLVNGDNVKVAYKSALGSVLASEKNNGLFLGKYKIDAEPKENALKNIDITDYFIKNTDAKSVGIYLTNLVADGFECEEGIASAMSDFSVEIKTYEAVSTYIELEDENGNLLDIVTVNGMSGDVYETLDYISDTFYKNRTKYTLGSVSANSITLGEEPVTVKAVYKSVDEGGLIYPSLHSGYSGTFSKEGSGMFVAVGDDAEGEGELRAPSVLGTSHIGGLNMASTRIGALEFEIDSDIDPNSIMDTILNFYVTGVHANLQSNWMRLGVYETENPSISNYTLGGMEADKYTAKNKDYSENAVYWSNEEISSGSPGWKTVNLRKIIVNALDNNNRSANPSEKVRIVLRLQVPVAGMYISPAGDKNQPYLKIITEENTLVLHYDFEKVTDDGKIEDISGNGFDGTLLDEAKIQDGKLVLNGNGGVKIDSEDFRSKLDSYTISTFVTLSGDAVNNTRIYDFGADAYNSGFLRVKDFAVGMKFNRGTTVLAAKNRGNITPFEERGKRYHLAVSYDGATNVTKVYVDGEAVIYTTDIKHSLNDFEGSDANNFIGRTLWHYESGQEDNNPDIKAVYEDFRVYSEAINDRMITAICKPGFENEVKAAAEYINEKLSPYTLAPVEEKLPFDTVLETESGEKITVIWHTSDSSVVDINGNVFKGVEDFTAEVYAEVSMGGYTAVTDVFEITVPALTEYELESSVILRYSFDGTGTEIEDSALGNNGSATSKNVQLQGRANLSKDEVIKLPDNINAGVTDYTVAAWVRTDDIANDGQRIYDFGIENGTVPNNYYAFTKINSDGTLTVGVNNGGSTQTVTSVGSISEFEWTHIAIVYNSSVGGTYIYINGELDSVHAGITYTMAGAVFNGESNSNYIGRSQWYRTFSEGNPDFKGKIDCFEFYSIPLSASFVKRLAEQEYDTPQIEIMSTIFFEGFDQAVMTISSNGYEGDVKVITSYVDDGMLKSMVTSDERLYDGFNSVALNIPEMGGMAKSENVKCFVWADIGSLTPKASASGISTVRSFSYDYKYPDNHLLSNKFSLRLYNTDSYLSLLGGAGLADWDASDKLLWTAPYEGGNAEGYYALKNKNGTYLALDTGIVKTDKINNWRFIQIDPELVGGAKNVYAIRQRSSGKYLASNGNSLVGKSSADDESAWWVLDIREYDTFSQLLVSPGFYIMSSNERSRLYGVTSQAMWQSSNRRNKLLEYIGRGYFSLSADEQAERLRKIFSYVPSSQISREVTPATTGVSTAYSLSDITGAANYTGKDGENLWAYTGTATYYTDSGKTDVQQTVTIYGRNPQVIKNIAEGFSYIPYQFRKYIRTIKDYYHTANEFNCGSSEMYVRTTFEMSAVGFATTASHEVGHSLSASWGYVHDTRYPGAMGADINKVSEYGNSHNAEDFAEFTQYVVSCAGDSELLRELKVMFPNRFGLLRTILREMNGGSCILDVVE